MYDCSWQNSFAAKKLAFKMVQRTDEKPGLVGVPHKKFLFIFCTQLFDDFCKISDTYSNTPTFSYGI